MSVTVETVERWRVGGKARRDDPGCGALVEAGAEGQRAVLAAVRAGAPAASLEELLWRVALEQGQAGAETLAELLEECALEEEDRLVAFLRDVFDLTADPRGALLGAVTDASAGASALCLASLGKDVALDAAAALRRAGAHPERVAGLRAVLCALFGARGPAGPAAPALDAAARAACSGSDDPELLLPALGGAWAGSPEQAIAATRHVDERVRAAVAAGSAQLPDVVVLALAADGAARVRAAACNRVARLGASGSIARAALLADADAGVSLRAMVALREPARQRAIEQALASDDPELRRLGHESAQSLEGEVELRALEGMLAAPEGELRAFLSFLESDQDEVLAKVAALAQSAPPPLLLRAAAGALARGFSDRAADVAASLCAADNAPRVRRAGFRAIAAFPGHLARVAAEWLVPDDEQLLDLLFVLEEAFPRGAARGPREEQLLARLERNYDPAGPLASWARAQRTRA